MAFLPGFWVALVPVGLEFVPVWLALVEVEVALPPPPQAEMSALEQSAATAPATNVRLLPLPIIRDSFATRG